MTDEPELFEESGRDHPLTLEGWPRPIVDGWPVPWVSPPNDLSSVDAGRIAAVIRLTLCQVCGEGHEPGGRVYLCVDRTIGSVQPGSDPTQVYVTTVDQAVMHERCARLALARCPRLRLLREEQRLLVLTASADDVETVWPDFDSDKVHLGVRADKVEVETSLSSTGPGPT